MIITLEVFSRGVLQRHNKILAMQFRSNALIRLAVSVTHSLVEDAKYRHAEPDLVQVEQGSFREKFSKSQEKSITCVFHE